MINTNDLIGLKRAWNAYPGDGSGTVDCCLLVLEVHKRLGYHDYMPEVQSIFSKYTDETWPHSVIPRWLLQNGTRLKNPKPHAVVLMNGNAGGAMGTVLDDGSVLYIGVNGVVRGPIHDSPGRYFWLNK
jgi:hypothetical protein